MCVIIFKPINEALSSELLEGCWHRNPDGGGCVYFDGTRVRVFKTLSLAKFLKTYAAKVKAKFPAIVHFRIATSGGINLRNCHPFRVAKDLYLAHNGILDIDCRAGLSDTRSYKKDVLQKLPRAWIENEAIRVLVAQDIGRGNKFAFMGSEGKVEIINQSLGIWDDGKWFSNAYHLTPKDDLDFAFDWDDWDDWEDDEDEKDVPHAFKFKKRS